MNKLLTTTLLCFSVGANATDTFDLANGHLLIPAVIAGDQKYTNLVVTIDQLISFGGFSQPVEKSVSTIRPDTFDLKRGQLIIPSVIAGDTEYRNLRITIKDVISYDNSVSTVADSGFNGEWYPEPYQLFVADDLPSTVMEGMKKTMDAAVELWGNFGPTELWVLGLDSEATVRLKQEYCDRRKILNNQSQNPCDNDANFETYRIAGIEAIQKDQQSGNNCRCGRPELGFHALFFSARWEFMDNTFRDGNWSPNGTDTGTLHEYWHAIHFSHITNKKNGVKTKEYQWPPPTKFTGPIWVIEGSAVYMAAYGMALLTHSNRLDYVKNPFDLEGDDLSNRMNHCLRAKAEYPDLNLGEYSYDEPDGSYACGAWAWAYLLNRTGNQNVLLDTFFPNLQTLEFEGAFQLTFGQSSSDFYLEFEEFLKLPIVEQVKILPQFQSETDR